MVGVITGFRLLPVLCLLETQKVNLKSSIHILYSFHCTHKMLDTVLRYGPCSNGPQNTAGETASVPPQRLFNESQER